MKTKLNRRDFLNLSIPATGAVLMAPGFMNFGLLSEINEQFSGDTQLNEYDLVINGAGLSGYFAAVEAVKKGLKVLLVDRRPAPGFEITAKRKLWIGADGLELFDKEMTNLFFPEQEKQEIFREYGDGPNNSKYGEELALFAGSIKKGLLRNLLLNKVHVLLMTDLCGVFSDKKNVSGVLVACKHGLYAVKCTNFIDASDNLIFSRNLFQQKYIINKAGFVLELLQTNVPHRRELDVPPALGMLNNRIILHPGKNTNDQAFLEMEFAANSPNFEEIEWQARLKTFEIGKELNSLDPSLEKAKINYYAYESSFGLSDSALPSPSLEHYYTFPSIQDKITCREIVDLQSKATQLLKKIEPGRRKKEAQSLILVGAEIPIHQVNLSDIQEPGFQVPLKKCSFDFEKYIQQKKNCQVLIGGGGTSGAFAGIAAQEAGADTIVVDYFNDMGGTKTLGGVMGYYHGMKDNPFIKEMEKESDLYTSDINASSKIKRELYLWKKFSYVGGRFLPAAIISDALVENEKVNGIVICRNGVLEVVHASLTIDATGDGDIASAAGASAAHGDSRTGQTQNYSQWNLTAGGTPPSNPSSDYDIIDNTKISEQQRALFLSHYEAHFYDFHPYLTVRESRRIKGKYTLNLIDAVEATHFEDLVSVASSDFDPHYIDNGEFTRCGFLLPHSNILQVEIPYRSFVPDELNGLLLSGKAFSQTHLALQFTRMSADLSILGYLTGQIAASIVKQDINPKEFDVKELQKKWYEKGYLPREYSARSEGNKLHDTPEIKSRVDNLALGNDTSLYHCCRLPKDLVLPFLKEKSQVTTEKKGKLLLAKALAWFGENKGNDLIAEELDVLFSEEQKNGYPGGYIEDYDNIRNRKENRLEGTFWRINQNIALLAMSGDTKSNSLIQKIIENTTSGGGILTRTGDRAAYFNSRIDLRIVPFYNRILNLCFYAERIPDSNFIQAFEALAADENIQGFYTEDYQGVRWRVYGSYLELYLAAAMARCGSRKGYEILIDYLNDIHFLLKNYALHELKSLTNKDFGFNAKSWKNFCKTLDFPQPCLKLDKEIEI